MIRQHLRCLFGKHNLGEEIPLDVFERVRYTPCPSFQVCSSCGKVKLNQGERR